jgi:hypothetical protein
MIRLRDCSALQRLVVVDLDKVGPIWIFDWHAQACYAILKDG